MLNTKRGVSIYLAVMIMAIMLAIVFGLNAILLGQIKTIRSMGYSVIAFYAAETGIENSLYIDDEALPGSLTNGSSYTVEKLDPGEKTCPAGVNYCFRSVGVFEGTSRAIQVSR
ncbi:MAG: hypothetical protein ABH813_02065 [Patescibacteria group bacterium]